MKFEEWFKIAIKFDFETAAIDIAPSDKVGMEHLKKWIKLIYNTGWNDGRGSKTTEQILSSLEKQTNENSNNNRS
jgi:hypothetical protein